MNVAVQLSAHHPFDEAAHVQRLWLISGGLAIAIAGLLAALHSGHPTDREEPDIACLPVAPKKLDQPTR